MGLLHGCHCTCIRVASITLGVAVGRWLKGLWLPITRIMTHAGGWSRHRRMPLTRVHIRLRLIHIVVAMRSVTMRG